LKQKVDLLYNQAGDLLIK